MLLRFDRKKFNGTFLVILLIRVLAHVLVKLSKLYFVVSHKIESRLLGLLELVSTRIVLEPVLETAEPVRILLVKITRIGWVSAARFVLIKIEIEHLIRIWLLRLLLVRFVSKIIHKKVLILWVVGGWATITCKIVVCLPKPVLVTVARSGGIATTKLVLWWLPKKIKLSSRLLLVVVSKIHFWIFKFLCNL